MAARLHDPGASRAVLVGTHTYDHLADLPAVEENLRALRAALTDPLVWGLPDEHCVVIDQPGSGDDVLEAIENAASAANDLLLVYFAGHGLLSPTDDSLDLALRGSRRDRTFRRLPYASVRNVLRDAGHLPAKAVLLDCCFAGRAIVGAMGDAPDLADMSQVEGTYLLAAASATQAAVAPPGERYTAFTGELLDILDSGIRTPHPYLDFGRIHDELVARLSAKGRPIPRQRNDGHGSRIILARNRQVPSADEGRGMPGPLRELLAAQERAASKFPYRLYGAPANALATVYVRQQTRSYTSDRERGRTETEPRDAHDASPRGPERERTTSGRMADLHTPEPSWRAAPTARSTAPAPLRAVDEILDAHRHLLIIGGPGQGKSTLTLQLAASLAAESRADDTASLLPLRVTASRLADLEGPWNTRVERALTDELGPFLDSPLPPDLLSRLPADRTRLLIVDGLDEITNPEQRRSFIAMLGSRLQDEDVPYRLLITSRPLPQNELEFLNQLALGTYTLEPFGREQLVEFAGRWFGETPSGRRRAQSFLHQIARTGVRELSRVPLLATIAAIVFGETSATSLPTSRFRLYEQYFAYLDRAPTGRHHQEQARILDDLTFAGPVHVQSVSLLFDNRRELIEHLAESVVKVRDPNEEPRDLLRAALTWLDARGCRPTRLQLPQWQTLVATHLGASGLFVLQGDRLRFVHYTFAEHIAADVRARALPPEFDADDDAWDELLAEASQANLQAWAVIVHHSNLTASGDALLTWLNSGGRQHQALAGSLLAAGIDADEGHASRFVEHVVQRLCGNLTELERESVTRDVAGLIQHPEMKAAIDRYLRTGYRTHEIRIALAQAIGPAVPYIAIDALGELLRDTRAPGAHRADAARVLAELDTSWRSEAVAVLQTIIASGDATFEDLRRAAQALGSISPESTAVAAAVLSEVIASPQASLGLRKQAAEALGSFGGTHVQTAALALCEIMSSESADVTDICSGARTLAELGGHYADQAAEYLRQAARDADLSDRVMVANSLMVCGSRYSDDVAQILREVAGHPDSAGYVRIAAAHVLHSLGEQVVAARVLRAAVADEDLENADRRSAATLLATVDGSAVHEAADALSALAADAYAAASARADSASALARLSKRHRSAAVALLREAASAATDPIHQRIEFLLALGLLDPAHTAEATAALRELLEDPASTWTDMRLIALALTTLGIQNTTCAGSVLRQVAEAVDAEQRVRGAAAEGLAALGAAYVPEAAGMLMAFADSDGGDGYERLMAARALASLPPSLVPNASAALAALARDEDAPLGIRREAVQQLVGSDLPEGVEGRALLSDWSKHPHLTVNERRWTAHAVVNLMPERMASVREELKGLLEDPDTLPATVVTIVETLADVNPTHAASYAPRLRELGRSRKATAAERFKASWALYRLGARFSNEGAELTLRIMEAEDVDIATATQAAGVLDAFSPRYMEPGIAYLRAARSDRALPSRDQLEVADGLRLLGPVGKRESVMLLRDLLTQADHPGTLRHQAASALVSSCSSDQRAVAGILRLDADDERAPSRLRASAAGRLLALARTDREHGVAVLTELLARETVPSERLYLAAQFDGAQRFDRTVADVAFPVLTADEAEPADRINAATLLSGRSMQYRDQAACVLRHIASSTQIAPAHQIAAASQLSGVGRRFIPESAELLRAIRSPDHRDMAAVGVATTLGALSPAYTPEATARLRAIALDPQTPPRARIKAAHGLISCSLSARRGIPDVLRAMITDPTTPPHRRREAARALGKFGSDGGREAAEILFAMADAAGPGTYARRAALRTAARLGLGYARQALVRFDALTS